MHWIRHPGPLYQTQGLVWPPWRRRGGEQWIEPACVCKICAGTQACEACARVHRAPCKDKRKQVLNLMMYSLRRPPAHHSPPANVTGNARALDAHPFFSCTDPLGSHGLSFKLEVPRRAHGGSEMIFVECHHTNRNPATFLGIDRR